MKRNGAFSVVISFAREQTRRRTMNAHRDTARSLPISLLHFVFAAAAVLYVALSLSFSRCVYRVAAFRCDLCSFIFANEIR